jgi:3-hydroxyisobutyrate dehydrogenase-like beta-hydroxyacid dehydrogenase
VNGEAKPAILFIGLGAMGRPMAERLVDVGNLTVSDLDRELARVVAETVGAKVADNPAKSAEEADFTVLSLPNSSVVEDVLLSGGVLNAMRPGSVIVDLSSSLPSSTIALAGQAGKRGVGFVDALPRTATGKIRKAELRDQSSPRSVKGSHPSSQEQKG